LEIGNIGTGYFHILTAVALAKEVGNIHHSPTQTLKNPNTQTLKMFPRGFGRRFTSA
jgi:hypothetical protein